MSHTCHAEGCGTEVPPKLFMCRKHWRMVPRRMQAAIWHHYRPGQEIDKHPTAAYLQAATEAIDAVRMLETATLPLPLRSPRAP